MERLQTLLEQARDQIIKLLTSEWLVTDVEAVGGELLETRHQYEYSSFIEMIGDQRRRELIRIRQMYIPELIIRLHYLLSTSRHRIPEFVWPLFCQSVLNLCRLNRNLKLALELVNIVADSRYKLYEDFVNEDGRRLGDYLGAVRQAILGGLEGGGSDPFRILMS